MSSLIANLAQQLGIDEATANAAASRAMSLLKENIGEDLFAQLGQAAPEAQHLADQPDPPGQAAGGGLLGSLAGMASQALGGIAGSSLELGAELANAGLPLDKIGPFVVALIGYLKQYVGEDLINQILERFPMLKQLLAQSGGLIGSDN